MDHIRTNGYIPRFFLVVLTVVSIVYNGSAAEGKAVVLQPTQYEEPELTRDAGMGFFSPDFYQDPVLYLYGYVNWEKPLSEHLPHDSIVFRRNELGNFDIVYAPPYLLPEHQKLDYGILYFRIRSTGWDFAEIVVNSRTGRTAVVSKRSGKMLFWPDFLLSVNSVEPLPGVDEPVRVKPLEHAGIVDADFDFIRPVRIEGDWIYGILLGDDHRERGKGWIRWRKGGKLLITWSLLS